MTNRDSSQSQKPTDSKTPDAGSKTSRDTKPAQGAKPAADPNTRQR